MGAETTERTTALEAEEATIARLAGDRRCTGVLLFGSHARGSGGAASDIDVLVLHSGPVPDDVFDDLPLEASVAFYTASRLARLPRQSPLFAMHLAAEGKIRRDDDGVLAALRRSVRPLNAATWATVAIQSRSRFRDLTSDLAAGRLDDEEAAVRTYALAKQLAMLHAASHGSYQFDRGLALRSLAGAHPSMASEVGSLAALESVWLANRSHNVGGVAPAISGAAAVSALGRLMNATVADGCRKRG